MKQIKVIFLKRKTANLIICVSIALVLGLLMFCFHSDISSTKTFTDPKSGIIVIDPGHGGVDGGTSRDGILEKEINLDIGKKVKSLLEQKGYSVVMTREKDVSLENLDNSNKGRHLRDLNARVNIINNSNAQLFLSIHVNCNLKKPSTNGSIVFYNNKFEQNESLAFCIQRTLNNIKLNNKNRTTHNPVQARYFVLGYTNVPGVIVETAFISNREEREEITKNYFREEISEAIAQGVQNYLDDSDKVIAPVATHN